MQTTRPAASGCSCFRSRVNCWCASAITGQPTFLKQRRLQAFALALEGKAIFKRRPVFAPLREPAQLAFVAREENRSAHPLSKRVRIAVHEVRSTLALFVSDKGDGMIVER